MVINFRSLALEWGSHGIRVNGIAPGPIANTPGMTKLAPGLGKRDEPAQVGYCFILPRQNGAIEVMSLPATTNLPCLFGSSVKNSYMITSKNGNERLNFVLTRLLANYRTFPWDALGRRSTLGWLRFSY